MDLNGQWINEFGSQMDLVVDNDGIVKGIYTSHTGASGIYRVVGITDIKNSGSSQTVAFSISWRPTDSQPYDKSFHWCSGFTGQLQVVDGQEAITSTYLLVKNTDPSDNWEDTVIDKCTFRRLSDTE